MKTVKKSLIPALLLLLVAPAPAQDVVMKAMRDELDRSIKDLKLASLERPYHITYRVDEGTTTTVQASLGAVTASGQERGRTFDVEIRVGDYAFDNTNFLHADPLGGMFAGTIALPLDDDYAQLRREMWLQTDKAYRRAAGAFASKRSVLQQRKDAPAHADFLKQPAAKVEQEPARLKVEVDALEKMAREASAVFREAPEVIASHVSIVVRDVYTRFVNTEGTAFTRAEPLVVVAMEAKMNGPSGVPLEDSAIRYGRNTAVLNTAEVVGDARALLARLKKLHAAPVLERYTGPVLFEGEAAGQLVAEVLAPAMTAARFPVTQDPQFEYGFQQIAQQFGGTSLADRLNARVLPTSVDLSDQPQAENFAGQPLLGARAIDDEGVPAREIKLVEAGILKRLISTRTPTPDTTESTGSKRMFGPTPSNLVLTTRTPKPGAEMRAEMLRLAKDAGYDFGVVVRRAGSGYFSWFARFAASQGGGAPGGAVEMVKVFADGREEVVRNVELGQITAANLRNIVAIGDKPAIYHGAPMPNMIAVFTRMAAGGMVGDPFIIGSFIAPAILLEDVTVKKAPAPAPHPPVAASPLAEAR